MPVRIGIRRGVREVLFAGVEQGLAQLWVGEFGTQQSSHQRRAVIVPLPLHARAQAIVQFLGGVEGEGEAGKRLAVQEDGRGRIIG